MLEIISRIFDYIIKIIPSFVRPVAVEIQQLYCQLLGSDPFQNVTVLTAWRKRFYVELLIINRKDSLVFIKDMLLIIDKEKSYKPIDEVTQIRLEPHQALKVVVCFGISDSETPSQEGNYELKVIPTFGRRTTVHGNFPIGNN